MSMNGHHAWTACELRKLIAIVLAVPDHLAGSVLLGGPEAPEVVLRLLEWNDEEERSEIQQRFPFVLKVLRPSTQTVVAHVYVLHSSLPHYLTSSSSVSHSPRRSISCSYSCLIFIPHNQGGCNQVLGSLRGDTFASFLT